MKRPAASPTVQTLALVVVVSAVGFIAGVVGTPFLLALAMPVAARPWALVTSVYAHASLAHLLVNALALALFGFAVERVTTRARFHAFFLVTGVLSGLAEIVLAAFVGHSVAVVGASGAILALFGYLLAGNALTGSILDRLGTRPRLALFVVVALVVTLLTAGPNVALVAHFTGLSLGLLAGRARVLHV